MLDKPTLTDREFVYLPIIQMVKPFEFTIDKELLEELSDTELIKGTARAREEYRRGKTGSLSRLAKILSTNTK